MNYKQFKPLFIQLAKDLERVPTHEEYNELRQKHGLSWCPRHSYLHACFPIETKLGYRPDDPKYDDYRQRHTEAQKRSKPKVPKPPIADPRNQFLAALWKWMALWQACPTLDVYRSLQSENDCEPTNNEDYLRTTAEFIVALELSFPEDKLHSAWCEVAQRTPQTNTSRLELEEIRLDAEFQRLMDRDQDDSEDQLMNLIRNAKITIEINGNQGSKQLSRTA